MIDEVTEMSIRNRNFKELLEDVKSLENNEPHMYDLIYDYQTNSKYDDKLESIRVAREFKDGK